MINWRVWLVRYVRSSASVQTWISDVSSLVWRVGRGQRSRIFRASEFRFRLQISIDGRLKAADISTGAAGSTCYVFVALSGKVVLERGQAGGSRVESCPASRGLGRSADG